VILGGCGSGKSTQGSLDPESFDVAQLPPNAERRFTELFFDASKAKITGDRILAKQKFHEALQVNPGSPAVKFELARIYAEEGNLTEAIDYASEASKAVPSNKWYAEYLGQLYAEAGKFDDSARIFRKILSNNPNDFDYYFHLAGLLTAQGRFEEAIKVYDELESKAGISEEVSNQRQVIYMERGDLVNALKETEKLIQANPEEMRYKGMKAELYERMGRSDEALALYLELYETDPSNGLVLLSLYEINKKKGRHREAADFMEKAFRSPDLSIDVKVNILLNVMNTAEYRKDATEALTLGSILETAHPTDAKSYAIQGDLHYNAGNLETSREKFRQAIAIDPNRPPIWQQILTISSQLNDFDAMQREGEASVELFPEQPVFYLFTGVGLLAQKNAAEALRYLESGKNLVVDNNALLAQFYASLGDGHHEAGNHAESDRYYEQCLKLDPSNLVVLNNYAYYLSLRGEKLDRAEQMAKKANDLRPNEPSFQDTYGWVLFKRNNFQNALFWIEEALKNGAGTDPTVLEHHGDVLYQLGRKADAARSWQAAMDNGGDAVIIQQKLSQPGMGE
jgi:tetratricopeptide (TPR) repeat protein